MARQFGRVQATGSYTIGGRSGRSFRGVYKQLSGTTMRVASSRLDGHTFQLNRTPSLSSFCCINSWYVVILCSPANSRIHINRISSHYSLVQTQIISSNLMTLNIIKSKQRLSLFRTWYVFRTQPSSFFRGFTSLLKHDETHVAVNIHKWLVLAVNLRLTSKSAISSKSAIYLQFTGKSVIYCL